MSEQWCSACYERHPAGAGCEVYPEPIRDSNWHHVFAYAEKPMPTAGSDAALTGFTREDVKRVIASVDGDNDGPEWVGVFELKDGRFAVVRAGCDYTGWG